MRGVRVGQRQAACASRLVRTMRGPRVLRVVAWSSGVEGQRRARKLGRSCTRRQTGDAMARTAGFDEMARRADELRGLEAGVFRRYDASYAEGHPCLRCGGGCACARWRVGGWHACKVHACVHCRRSAGLTGLTVQPSSIIDYSDACRSFGVRAVLTGLCARRAGRFGEQSIACVGGRGAFQSQAFISINAQTQRRLYVVNTRALSSRSSMRTPIMPPEGAASHRAVSLPPTIGNSSGVSPT